MSAVLVKGNALGTSLYYGAGAGDEATASAVIADLIDIINSQANNHILGWEAQEQPTVLESGAIESEFYMRLLVSDKRGVLANITSIFSNNNVSIESLIQKQVDADNNAHIAIITNKTRNENVHTIKAEIEACEFNQESVKIIHIETLD